MTDDVVSTTYKSTAFLANTGTTPQPHCHANLIGSHILLRKCVPPLPPKKLSNFNRSSSFSVAGTDINDANEFNSFTARFFCSSVVVVMFWEGGQDMTVPQLLSTSNRDQQLRDGHADVRPLWSSYSAPLRHCCGSLRRHLKPSCCLVPWGGRLVAVGCSNSVWRAGPLKRVSDAACY